MPTIARIGVLVSPTEVQDSVIMHLLSAPAHALGLTVTIITVRDAAGIGAAFAAAARDNVQALFVSQSPFFNTHRVKIAAQAARARLPAIYGFREFADAGGLMSHGPSLPDVYRRFATLVDKILKGASPPICRSKSRRGSPLSSISEPPRPSISRSRNHSCCARRGTQRRGRISLCRGSQ